MTRPRAKRIAERHIRQHNPNYWNGTGDKRSGFDSEFSIERLDAWTILRIHYELSPGAGWMTRYIITDAVTGETVVDEYHDILNDADKMAACIQSVCKTAERRQTGGNHASNRNHKP